MALGPAPTSSSRSRNPRGAPGDRGLDLRRRAGERDPALLPAANTPPAPRPTRGASNGASTPAAGGSGLVASVSSAAGTRRSRDRCRTSCATSWASRSGSRYTPSTGASSPPIAGAGCRTKGLVPSGSCSRAPGRRTPPRRTSLYVEGLAAPHTVNTMPEKRSSPSPTTDVRLPAVGRPRPRRCAQARFAAAGVDVEAVGATAGEGRGVLREVWSSLLERIETRAAQVASAG